MDRIKRYGEPPVDQLFYNEDAVTAATIIPDKNYDLIIDPHVEVEVEEMALFGMKDRPDREASAESNGYTNS